MCASSNTSAFNHETMLIFYLCKILATLNFSPSEEKIRENSIKYFFDELHCAYTSKASAVHLHLSFVFIAMLLNLFCMYTLNIPSGSQCTKLLNRLELGPLVAVAL